MRRLTGILLVLLASSMLFAGHARTLRWETVDSGVPASRAERGMAPAQLTLPSEEQGVEIYVENGFIYVSTDHEIPVSVYSILGQMIGTGELQPGIYRMPMSARGIYIIRAGMSTVRVTL